LFSKTKNSVINREIGEKICQEIVLFINLKLYTLDQHQQQVFILETVQPKEQIWLINYKEFKQPTTALL
jgi:hypothetical protein